MKDSKLTLKPGVKKILTIILGSVLLICLILLGIGFIGDKPNKKNENKTVSKSEDFKVVKIDNDLNKYTIQYASVKDANKYQVEIIDSENNKIVSSTSEKLELEVELPLNVLKNGSTFRVQVTAYKDDEVIKRSDSSKEIKWDKPSINVATTNLDNKEFSIDILGNVSKDNKIVVLEGTKELTSKELDSNKYTIPINLYKNKTITLTLNLYEKDKIISTINLSNEYKVSVPTTTKVKNPINDIKITSPAKYTYAKTIGDINLEFTGGEGANSFSIKVYENNNLIINEALSDKKYKIPASTFKSECGYRIVVEGVSGSFTKSDSIFVSTITDGRKKIVDLAQSQMGIYNGEKFWRWWGYSYRVEWCAIFISWCGDQLGYLDAGILPRFQGVGEGVKWFKERNQFQPGHSTYIPKPGDIIFYNYNDNASIDHVGIVKATDGEYVYTLEGNTGKKPGTSAEKKRRLNDKIIYGYGVPNY